MAQEISKELLETDAAAFGKLVQAQVYLKVILDSKRPLHKYHSASDTVEHILRLIMENMALDLDKELLEKQITTFRESRQ